MTIDVRVWTTIRVWRLPVLCLPGGEERHGHVIPKVRDLPQTTKSNLVHWTNKRVDRKKNLLDHVCLLAVGELEASKVAKEGHKTHELIPLKLSISADDFIDTDRVVGQEGVGLRRIYSRTREA
jgi:hypothetical protein